MAKHAIYPAIPNPTSCDGGNGGVGPAGPPGPAGPAGQAIIETAFAEVTADIVDQEFPVFTTIATAVIGAEAGDFLEILATFSAVKTDTPGFIRFRVVLNGTPLRAASVSFNAEFPESGAIVQRPLVTLDGAQIVELQVSGSDVNIRPITFADEEHAALYVQRIPTP